MVRVWAVPAEPCCLGSVSRSDTRRLRAGVDFDDGQEHVQTGGGQQLAQMG